MSKIEQALEKAVRMRESVKDVPAEKATVPDENQTVMHTFEIADGCIDTSKVDKHIVCITEPYSVVVEQYKKLRAKVLRATTKDMLNTIMVTSAGIGEGKTMTSINLAVSLAHEIDYTVLLVDGDLRNPSVHKYLGIDSRYGLSDYLKGDAELKDVLVKTGIGKLVILPGSNPPENAAELLSSERMKMLVHELKNRYKNRYIIFDSSPLLVTADPISLGGFMDAVLFVIQEGRTSRKAAEEAISLMKGWNILGAVFNNVPMHMTKTLYPYYYQYSRYASQKKDDNISKSEAEK
ncbi:MAG: polysaccharide biosynthesis tyrosine autokinase [Nitrospirota bacterium]